MEEQARHWHHLRFRHRLHLCLPVFAHHPICDQDHLDEPWWYVERDPNAGRSLTRIQLSPSRKPQAKLSWALVSPARSDLENITRSLKKPSKPRSMTLRTSSTSSSSRSSVSCSPRISLSLQP